MIDDYKIIEIIEKKISETRREEQKEWVRKYDIFMNRNLFNQYNQAEKLKEVEKIRNEILDNESDYQLYIEADKRIKNDKCTSQEDLMFELGITQEDLKSVEVEIE